MRILEMRATFGCLDHAVLRPEEGVNVFTLPNEQGKTTWSQFLLTMFYGLETRKRGEKARYQPWNGAPMEGTVVLRCKEQTIVLQRTSERGKPMGVFRAYDRDTGMTIPWLTGENCGEKLLGVPRSVYSRTAFLRGEELAVTQDGELAARLTNLAAAGEGGDSYPAAEQRLKSWKNRIRYHKTGLLPEKEAELAAVRERLQAAAELEAQRLATEEERIQQVRELEALTGRMEQERQDQQRLTRDAVAQANLRMERLISETAVLPSEGVLRELAAKLEQSAPEAREEPPCPPALQGLDEAALLPKAQRDLAAYDSLKISMERSPRGLILGMLGLLAAAILLLAIRQWIPGGIAAAYGVFLGFAWWRHGLRAKADRQKAASILEQYGVTERDSVLETAVSRRDWLLWQQGQDRKNWELDILLEETAVFAPQAQTVEQASAAVRDALALLEKREAARKELERVLRPMEPDTRSREEQHRLQLRCALLQTQAESLQGQIDRLGGWEQLDARRQLLERELDELAQKERALDLALEALASAEQQMSRVYAPRLTGLAGERLTWLTGGRYDGLILKQGFELLVREQETGLTRPLSVLSRGTQDQTWLALRLAMTDLLLPAEIPLVLDDVLLTFDPARTAQAAAALEQTGRQVLLFSCRPIL